MQTDATRRCQLSGDAVVFQVNFVIARMHDLVVMRKLGLVFVHAQMTFEGPGRRHDRNPRHLPRVDMTETPNVLIVIQVAGLPTAFGRGVGAKVDHPKRPTGRREIEPARLVSINLRIDKTRQILRLSGQIRTVPS